MWETDEDDDEDDDEEDDDEDDDGEDDDDDEDMMMMMDSKVFPSRSVTRNDPRSMPCFAYSKGNCNQGYHPYPSFQ